MTDARSDGTASKTTASELIKHLELLAHPEGGWYRETYRAAQKIAAGDLPAEYGSDRSVSTSIHFLLQGGQKSHFHRLRSDEIWYFHSGCPVRVLTLTAAGEIAEYLLGSQPQQGMAVHLLIPAGTWFAADIPDVSDPELYSLVSCVVTPGFEFEDFELAERANLSEQFPQYKSLIQQFTRV